MSKKKWIIVGVLAVVVLVVIFWPRGGQKPKPQEQEAVSALQVQAVRAEAEKAKAAVDQAKAEAEQVKAELAACQEKLAACEEAQQAKARKAKKAMAKAGVARSASAKAPVKAEPAPVKKAPAQAEQTQAVAPSVSAETVDTTDTTPRLATPAEVEVSEGRVCVKTSGFARVVFFGSYGVCAQPLKYVDLRSDGCAAIPDLPPECRWFNFIASDGKWAIVAGGTGVKGAKVVEETRGPFKGAHAFALEE